ncbi:MAG: hypothetical protein IPK21_09610 [Haliscomenobacter sp.]|nr:hypothetical protein [Haliscomenobacter sp.]
MDITIKERILSLYALSILQTKERRPKAVNEFEVFVTDFLKSKSSSYDEKAIPDILKYFIKDIDLLFVEDNQYVKFKHDSFMEYFAALEIFNQKRELQSELVNRFTELNWQNTSIFYAGRSKDMPEFLKQITSKIASYDRLVDVFIASSGFGYLLQALYLTDESIRKDAIKIATHLNLKLFEKIKIFASEETNFFSGLTLPQVASLSTIYFLFSYDSLTLKGAISMAFDELMEQYLDFDSQNDLRAHSVAYQMFNLAVTLNSEKINDPSKLSQLFEAKNILNIPIMVLLFERVLDFVNPSFVKNQREKKKIRERMIKNIENVNYYIKTPIKELRYTKFDNINSLKNVKIFTEGETDSVIINTAYNVLTGDTPYWEIRQCGNASTGGAQTLSKMLSTIPPPSPEDVIIGLFDNDSKGIQEFESLKETFF